MTPSSTTGGVGRLAAAQSHIRGHDVACMIMDFHREFNGVYLDSVMSSDLCAVGPLQAMIGLAIKNGLLKAVPS